MYDAEISLLSASAVTRRSIFCSTVADHVLQFMRVIVLQLAQVDVDRRIAVSEVAAAGADELAALLNFYAAHFERVAALGALEKACQPGVLSRIGAGKLCLV